LGGGGCCRRPTVRRLDIIINNAGLFLGKGIEEASLAEWHRLCAVNLTGVFLGTKLALPALRDTGAHSPQGSAIAIRSIR
jgi:NADP-dependent 3-hydroxy acid dehydrogenase YdfG